MELTQTQVKYPLSPRKFWKKVVTRTIVSALTAFAIVIVVILILLALGPEQISTSYGVTSVLVGIFLFLGIFFLLGAGPYAWYVNVYIQRYYYSLDENFITIRKGVFTPTEIHVQYVKIQDVYVDQDLFDRMFGIYDVHIASATVSSGIEAHIDGVSAEFAEGLKNEILDKIQHRPTQATVPAAGATPAVAKMPATPVPSISSAQYPISTRWLYSILLSTLIHAAYSLGLVIFYALFGLEELDSTSKVWVLFSILVLGVGGALFRLGYNIWWKKNYYFEFEPEYIVLKQGVISREERHIQYSSIQNVTLKQKISDRILGICDVVIENAAAGSVGVMAGIPAGGMPHGISNGIVIPGQMLSDGQKLVEIVNKVTVEKNVNLNPNGL